MSTGEFKTVFEDGITIHFLGIQEGMALCCTVLIMMVLIWAYFSFKDHPYYNNSTSSILFKMKTLCIISILSYLVMSVTMSILLNNFVVMSAVKCQTLYVIYFAAYNSGNITMYFLMSYQIESIFPSHISKIVAIPTCLLQIYRMICVLLPSLLWAIYISLAFPHIHVVEISNYKFCYAQQFTQPFWAQICLVFNAFFHAIFIFFFLFAMASAAINYTTFLSEIDFKTRLFIQNLSNVIRKNTMVCLISVISTVALLGSSAYILQQMIFFLVINGIIHVYCVVCLLDIGQPFYDKTFGKVEKICICTNILQKHLSQNNSSVKRGPQKRTNKGNNGYKAPKTIAEEVKQTGYLRLEDVSFSKNIPINNPNSITPFSGILPYSVSQSGRGHAFEFRAATKSSTTYFGQSCSTSKAFSEIELQNTLSNV